MDEQLRRNYLSAFDAKVTLETSGEKDTLADSPNPLAYLPPASARGIPDRWIAPLRFLRPKSSDQPRTGIGTFHAKIGE